MGRQAKCNVFAFLNLAFGEFFAVCRLGNLEDIPVTLRTPRNISELLALNGERFIEAMYLALLGRSADEPGLAHHLAALRGGVSKLKIAEDFVRSEEGRRFGAKLPGLAEALIEAKVADIAEALAGAGRDEDVQALVDYVGLLAPAPADDRTFGREGSFVTVKRSRTVGPDLVIVESGMEDGANLTECVWYDLTDLFQPDQTAGQVRAQLAFIASLRRVCDRLRYLLEVEEVLMEVEPEQLVWLFDQPFMADAFSEAYFPTYADGAPQLSILALPSGISHPCSLGDIVVSWASIGKKTDRILSRPNAVDETVVKLCHVFSDERLSAMASLSKDDISGGRFARYVRWLSKRSHVLIFTSDSARATLAALQKKINAPSPPHVALKNVSQLAPLDDGIASAVIADLGIAGRYALYAGAFDTQSNLETVYRAWLLAQELGEGTVPWLVLALSSSIYAPDLLEAMQVDPRLKNHLIILTPSEQEYAALLTQAAFVLCPAIGNSAATVYDEAIRFGKACIVSDSPSFAKGAPENVVRVHAIDVRGWANAILYLNSKPAVAAVADEIARARASSANEAELALALATVRDSIVMAAADIQAGPPAVKPTIWMDLTLTFLDWGGHITGIVRAELTFAYYLKKLAPDTRYFAYTRGSPGYFFEIEQANLDWLFNAVDLSESYRSFNLFWKNAESKGEGYRDPFRLVGQPVPGHPAYLGSFPSNSIVFFAAIDQDGTGNLSRCPDVLKIVDDRQASMTSQLIYDLTPFLMPQVHHEFTVRGYLPFVQFVSDHFDHLVYGGRTAQRDAIQIQQDAGWRSPPSTFVEFGSDISLSGDSNLPPTERPRSIVNEKIILERLGINGAFLITVGSLEPRKNHEILYKAYLELLDRGSLERPFQMVFIGKRGWKIDDLLATIASDERVRGKLLILSPTDEELEALYHQCSFTLLPSFYEGWSLTLPESLSYGKFCLVSDVDPLREAGADLVEYIHPLDTMAWADRIEYYLNRPDEVAKWEQKIRQGWHPRTWHEASASLIERLQAAHAERFPY